MAALRAGLIGLGMMGRNHARVLRSLDGVDLVGVADPMGDRHGAAGGLGVCDSVHGLIDLGLDYCVVAVPTAITRRLASRSPQPACTPLSRSRCRSTCRRRRS